MGNNRRIIRRAPKEHEDVTQIYSDYTTRVHVTYRVTKHATRWSAAGRDNYYTVIEATIFAIKLPRPLTVSLNAHLHGRNEFIAYITAKTKEWDKNYG